MRYRYLLLGWLLFDCSAALSVRAEPVFRAGVATGDITPAKPLPMWGYGARHQLLSTGTRDPLHAKAIVFEAGDVRLAVVGLDLGRSLGDPHLARIQAAVQQAAAVDYVLLSGSHTHHGPVLELKDVPGQGRGTFDDAVQYVAQLEGDLIDVICRAAARLEPAQLGWASQHLDLNRNRQARVEPKPRDTELAVLRVDDLTGKPLAILVNFAAHPTLLEGSDLRWSADYPGALSRHVEAELQTCCIFLQGAAGDLSPQPAPDDSLPEDDPRLAENMLKPDFVALLRKTFGLDDDRLRELQRKIAGASYRTNAFGRRLAEHAVQLARDCQTRVPPQPAIQCRYDTFAFRSRVDFQNPALRLMFGIAFFPELAAAAASDYTDNRIPARLTTVLLNGELALVGGSGEFFSGHALRLKERCHTAKALFIGYCNGHHMYFPTIEAAAQGGYGADPQMSWAEVGAGEQMMNQALIHIFDWQGKLAKSPFAP